MLNLSSYCATFYIFLALWLNLVDLTPSFTLVNMNYVQYVFRAFLDVSSYQFTLTNGFKL